MMKYIKITSILFILVLFGACEQDFNDDKFQPRDRTSGWVQFGSTETTQFTSVGEFKLPVDVNVPINKNGFTINYTVEVVEGSAPQIETGTFDASVPANSDDPNITLNINPENISQYAIQVTLNSVSADNITVGIEGTDRPTVFTLGITCPVPLNYTGTTFIGDSPINTFDLELTPTDSPNEFLMNTAWGDFVAAATGDPSFAGQFQYVATLVVNDDNTVDIVADDPDTFPGGTGVISTCEGTLNYTLEQAVFTTDFTVDVELVAND
jgi:hypothetical protein